MIGLSISTNYTPEIAIQFDGVIFIKNDPFLKQSLLLNLIALKMLQGNFAIPVYDSVPG